MADNFKFISDKEFHEQAKKGETGNTGIWKAHTPEIKNVDEKARTVDFVISTESVDRMGDTISVRGWQLDSYEKNPVVLFGHDHGSPPIGRATKIVKRPKKKTLEATAEFMDKEISPFADMIFNMYKNGFMKATSVGFVPLEFKFTDDEEREMGIDFLKQDLLEFSAVSVPANPEALMGARSKGIDTAPLYEYAEEALDAYEEHVESGLVIPRKTIEQMRAASDPKQRKQFSKSSDQIRKENLESITESDKDMAIKHVISYSEAHSDGTPKADKDESWDGPSEVSEAGVDELETMSAWRKQEPTGDDGEFNKGDYKLPHHKAGGDHAVVWRGVANAAARLPQTDVPEDDVPGIQEHLGKHYAEFDETPPWEDQEESWKAYVEVCRTFKDNYTRGLDDGNEEELSPIYELGKEIFPEDVMKSLVEEMVDHYALERAQNRKVEDVEDKEIEADSKAAKDEADEDEVVDIPASQPDEKAADNADIEDKEVDDENVEEAETPAEEVVDKSADDPEVDTEDKELGEEKELDPQVVAEALLEMMELTYDLIEAGEFDELLDTRKGYRTLKNITEATLDFNKILESRIANDEEVEQKDTEIDSETDEDFIELDEAEEKDVDDDDLDMDEEDVEVIMKAIPELIREEIRKAMGKVD